MTIPEFSDQFDVLYNNITSNQAPGLNEYEKSLFLTKSEKEIVKNHFTATSKGNSTQLGFDDSAKRQADFSVLMKTAACNNLVSNNSVTNAVYTSKKYTCVTGDNSIELIPAQIKFTRNSVSYNVPDGEYPVVSNVDGTVVYILVPGEGMTVEQVNVTGFPFTIDSSSTITVATTTHIVSGKLDDRSTLYTFPKDTFIVVNESIKTTANRYLQVIPLKYDEYTRLMSKPFKRPVKNQAWRLINSGTVTAGTNAPDITSKYVEIITNSWDTVGIYNIRYVRVPKPIILADLDEGISIDGESSQSETCEIDPILHEDILQRAVELAKIAWTVTGNENIEATLASGQRSE